MPIINHYTLPKIPVLVETPSSLLIKVPVLIISNLIEMLKNTGFMLIDFTIIDNMQKTAHLFLCYNLMKMRTKTRIFIKVSTSTGTSQLGVVPAIKSFKSSEYLEKEAYDLFGQYFENHVDLRRILTDYGFKGYPLKKIYPLVGITEIRFSHKIFSIRTLPVTFAQNLRNLHTSNQPWITMV